MDQTHDTDPQPHDERTAGRAELLPEEEAAGSDNAMAQAEAILEDSDQRTEERDDPAGPPVEHRTSDQATEPT